jgi:hypothetical protein
MARGKLRQFEQRPRQLRRRGYGDTAATYDLNDLKAPMLLGQWGACTLHVVFLEQRFLLPFEPAVILTRRYLKEVRMRCVVGVLALVLQTATLPPAYPRPGATKIFENARV